MGARTGGKGWGEKEPGMGSKAWRAVGAKPHGNNTEVFGP